MVWRFGWGVQSCQLMEYAAGLLPWNLRIAWRTDWNIETKSSQHLLTLPGQWYYDDAETSAFNVNLPMLNRKTTWENPEFFLSTLRSTRGIPDELGFSILDDSCEFLIKLYWIKQKVLLPHYIIILFSESLDSEDVLRQNVETLVANNSPSQDFSHPDDLFQSRYVTPRFKPFS